MAQQKLQFAVCGSQVSVAVLFYSVKASLSVQARALWYQLVALFKCGLQFCGSRISLVVGTAVPQVPSANPCINIFKNVLSIGALSIYLSSS